MDYLILTSLFVGCVVPITGMIVGCFKSVPCEEENSEEEDEESSGEEHDSSNDKKFSSFEESIEKKSEKVSFANDTKKVSSNVDTQDFLQKLSINCDNILQNLQFPDSEKAFISSLIDNIISSPKFYETIKENRENPDMGMVIAKKTLEIANSDEGCNNCILRYVENLSKGN